MTEFYESFSAAWQQPLFKYYVSTFLVAWPCLRICMRYGVSQYAPLLLTLPYIGFVALPVFLAVKTKGAA